MERFAHLRVVEVQVRLVRIEAMPIIGLSDRIPGPVGGFEVFEDDACFLIFLLVVTPDVEIARAAAGLARRAR